MHIIFNSQEMREKLPVYRVKFQDKTLYIQHPQGTVCISTLTDFRSHKQTINEAISAFLRTNPTSFISINKAMLMSTQHPEVSPSFSEEVLYEIERIADRMTLTLFKPSPISYPFVDFRTEFLFPLLPEYDYHYDWILSHESNDRYFVLNMSDDNLIKVSIYSFDSSYQRTISKFSSTPVADERESLLSIPIFMEAIRQFIELDFNGFVNAFIKIKEHYNKMSPACNAHYYQLCLMTTAYDHFYNDVFQAAHCCGLIDID